MQKSGNTSYFDAQSNDNAADQSADYHSAFDDSKMIIDTH